MALTNIWTTLPQLIFRRVRKFLEATCHVCSSVRMEQLGSHWTDFHEIWHLSAFRKSVAVIRVSLKSDKNNGHFTLRPIYVFDHISLSSS